MFVIFLPLNWIFFEMLKSYFHVLVSITAMLVGHGGFGHVVLCKNKLDGRQYAVKKIRLNDKSLSVNEKILR